MSSSQKDIHNGWEVVYKANEPSRELVPKNVEMTHYKLVTPSISEVNSFLHGDYVASLLAKVENYDTGKLIRAVIQEWKGGRLHIESDCYGSSNIPQLQIDITPVMLIQTWEVYDHGHKEGL